ncbi:hypothetical protein DRN73_06685 [Candidatus Pacearchaeota archaeon]|nr:MAG: hypothetical protein DRN73_06685 [Candidatus Pacearchaeota archaeon]
MDKIVIKNLERMIGKGKDDMEYVLMHEPESMGGNAGFYEGFSCLAINFYYDSETGEIKFFGNFNYQVTPKRLRNIAFKGRPYEGTFRMAVYLDKKSIVNLSLNPKSSKRARFILEDTAYSYNKISGSEEKPIIISEREEIFPS